MNFKEFTKYIFDNNLEIYHRVWQKCCVRNYETKKDKKAYTINFNELWQTL